MSIANNFDEFVEVISEAERKALNNEVGQKMTEELLKMKLESNPDMTPEEWQQTKSDFMYFIFNQILLNSPELRDEFSGHLYDKLRKEA